MRTLRLALTLAFSWSLLSVSACGEETTSPSDSSKDDDGDDVTDDEDDETQDDEDKGSTGKIDAGKIDAGKVDAGKTDPEDDTKPDAGKKADASTVKPDAGKTDAGGTTTDPNRLKPKCVKKDSQVMVVGDSYINWITHSFPQDMIDVSKQTWRMEAIGAYSMGSGGIGFIPDQYRDSIKRDPDCHTILMDGGGNDILVADGTIDPNRDCLTDKAATLPQCQTIIDKAIAAAQKLLDEGSAAGVRDVVYFFYPHVPEGTLLGGPSPNTVLDFALPQVKKFCDDVEGKTGGKTRCTFIDMVPVFKGHDDWFFPGDIHETGDGSKAMTKKIWEVMKEKCIAQPSGAGCCEE